MTANVSGKNFNQSLSELRRGCALRQLQEVVCSRPKLPFDRHLRMRIGFKLTSSSEWIIFQFVVFFFCLLLLLYSDSHFVNISRAIFHFQRLLPEWNEDSRRSFWVFLIFGCCINDHVRQVQEEDDLMRGRSFYLALMFVPLTEVWTSFVRCVERRARISGILTLAAREILNNVLRFIHTSRLMLASSFSANRRNSPRVSLSYSELSISDFRCLSSLERFFPQQHVSSCLLHFALRSFKNEKQLNEWEQFSERTI